MSETRSLSKTKRSVFFIVLLLGLPVLLLFLVEGSVSLLMFGRDYRNQQTPRNSRPHTTYDTLLGWVNRPGSSNPDEYGKGIGLTTNGLGFRGSSVVNVSDTTTPRLVCSGDSFTLGYGVADEQTWCHLLESYFPGLQTLNMGQGAYGLDQAFLWYRRDGVPVPHRYTVFSMTYVEMERTVTSSFMGRFKPTLAVKDGALRAENVPVPPQTDESLRRAYANRLFNNLRIVQALRRLPAFEGTAGTTQMMRTIWPTFDRTFAELDSLNRARGSELVLAYLPTRADLSPGPLDERRVNIAKFAEAHHVRFIDLTPALRAMRGDSADLSFISKIPAGAAPGVGGHYTKLGNAWAARELASRLRDIPALNALSRNAGAWQ
ncbi:MAG: hypothetical protein H7Z40_03285 [Phycisphaerae bacterium]|nr:hypothetical protein [Gemmatimonadaceae bacterium]